MEINTATEMLKAIGRPVEIDLFPLNKKTKSDTTLSGNIVAVDPDTRSIGLLQFHASKDYTNKIFYYSKPSHIVYIPGSSVKEIHDLKDGPFGDDMNYCEQTPELLKLIDKLFSKSEKVITLSEAEISERRQKIIKFLVDSSLPYCYQENEGTFTVGAVKIRSPYSKDTCFSENQLALGRLRDMISKIFA